MNQSENKTTNANSRALSAEQLRGLLRNPPGKIIKESNEKKSIEISGYTFEDEYLILNEITLDLPLIFHGCTFNADKSLFISGLICNESLIFDNCTISNTIFFSSGTFKKKVVLKHVHVKSIHLSYCTFNEISVSGYDIEEFWMAGSKFKSLNIGEFLNGNNISKLSIFVKEDETGDITIRDQGFDTIYLSGTNKDNTINLDNIKCNNISINEFKNEGELNIHGIEPKNTNINDNYFQIINSNLDNVQFFRALFSEYKELIIVDSFITDTLFIGCKFSNNVRAIYGPGFNSFEDSLDNGRKITNKEIISIKEAYRQLKISMSKHSDKIQELKFYSQELNFHNMSLSWTLPWTNQFWDKIILIFSRTFSDYGQSFIKPLSWLLLGHYFLFLIAILLNGFDPLQISFSECSAAGFKEAFEKFFIYINPFRSLETSLSGYLILLDTIMRVWSSFMIYNLIRSTRRFIS